MSILEDLDINLLRVALFVEMSYTDGDFDQARDIVEQNISRYGEQYYTNKFPGVRNNPPAPGPGFEDRAAQIAEEDSAGWAEAVRLTAEAGLTPGTTQSFLVAAIQTYYDLTR